jgi:hypothetical protein
MRYVGSVLYRLSHPALNHFRVFIHSKAQRPLKAMRPSDQHLHAPAKGVGADPRLVGTGQVPAACLDGGFNALSARGRDALDVEDRNRYDG